MCSQELLKTFDSRELIQYFTTLFIIFFLNYLRIRNSIKAAEIFTCSLDQIYFSLQTINSGSESLFDQKLLGRYMQSTEKLEKWDISTYVIQTRTEYFQFPATEKNSLFSSFINS